MPDEKHGRVSTKCPRTWRGASSLTGLHAGSATYRYHDGIESCVRSGRKQSQGSLTMLGRQVSAVVHQGGRDCNLPQGSEVSLPEA
uniref:Uncharacterized protein n=1 Tax=Hyaloperonospora arabidopsidis (strain Emoy2) TaxID=559515 RepID=M4BAJ5_HYAAE